MRALRPGVPARFAATAATGRCDVIQVRKQHSTFDGALRPLLSRLPLSNGCSATWTADEGWGVLGGGDNPGVNGEVRAIAVVLPTKSIVFGGDFNESRTGIDVLPVGNVVAFSTEAQHFMMLVDVNSDAIGVDDRVLAVAAFDTRVFIGGEFLNFVDADGGVVSAAARLAHYDINLRTWNAASVGVDGRINAIAILAGNAIIGGAFSVSVRHLVVL